MTEVNNRFESTFRNLVDQIVELDGVQAQDRQINYQDIALSIGQGLNEAEKNALQSFALPDDATPEQKIAIGKKLGLSEEKARNATPDGLRQVANLVLSKVRNLMEMFTNLINAKKRTDDAIINNFRP